MKLSEIIVNILAKKQKKPASAIYTKYGPALEAADEAYIQNEARILLEIHKATESAIGAKCEDKEGLVKSTHTEEPTSFSQPTKFANPSDRTEFVAGLQFDLEASRERMKRLWEEKESADRAFQQRIDHESQQIDLIEARIHLTHSTPAGEPFGVRSSLCSPFVKGGL